MATSPWETSLSRGGYSITVTVVAIAHTVDVGVVWGWLIVKGHTIMVDFATVTGLLAV